MSMPEPRVAITGNTPMPKSNSPEIVEYNAEQAIGILVAESNVCNEWGGWAMWLRVCWIVRQGRKGQRWTKDELNRMMAEAEDE